MTKRKSTRKLAPAKDWRNRDIDDWNTLTFTEYLRDRHREVFGIEYAPMRSWQFEQGILGRLIGTKTKKGTHSKAVVKRFIDEAFAEYKPSAQYPGTNLGFSYAYRRNILQRVEAEEATKDKRDRHVSKHEENLDDLSEWLNGN